MPFRYALLASAGAHALLLTLGVLAGALPRLLAPNASTARRVQVAARAEPPSPPAFAEPPPERATLDDVLLPEDEREPALEDPPDAPLPPLVPRDVEPPPRRPVPLPEVADDRALAWRVPRREPEPEDDARATPEVAPAEPAAESPATVVHDEPLTPCVDCPPPRYPRLAVRAGEEGIVRCRLDVGADGRVERVELLRSSGHPRLDDAALAALGRWRFAPSESGDGWSFRHAVTFLIEETR